MNCFLGFFRSLPSQTAVFSSFCSAGTLYLSAVNNTFIIMLSRASLASCSVIVRDSCLPNCFTPNPRAMRKRLVQERLTSVSMPSLVNCWLKRTVSSGRVHGRHTETSLASFANTEHTAPVSLLGRPGFPARGFCEFCHPRGVSGTSLVQG